MLGNGSFSPLPSPLLPYPPLFLSPESQNAAQAGLEVSNDPPAHLSSHVLGLKVSATTPGLLVSLTDTLFIYFKNSEKMS